MSLILINSTLAWTGYPEVTNMTYLASSGLCIGAIACLSHQSTARLGNTLGLMGVTGGIAATLGLVNGDPALYGQILGEAQENPSRLESILRRWL